MPKVKANGIELYYELHGPEAAPVLALSNGILMSTASWAFQTPAFSKRHRLLLYDCRGQWQSEHPEGPYSMELHADDLAALLDALGIESAHMGGISYGGEVAQAFVLKYPARVRSLILADTVSEVGPELRMVIEGWMAPAHSADAPGFFNATVPWNFSPEFIRANSALWEDARKRYALLDFPAVVRLCECFLGLDLTKRLGEIRAPTCIVVGEKDLIKGPVYAEILRKGIPHAELHIVRGSGHATCWERVNEFNTIVLGFLAQHGG